MGNVDICNDLNRLKPEFKPKVEHMLKVCKSKGMKVLVFETYRTPERQAYLYKMGRSKLKKAGMHGKGLAVDIVFLVNGVPSWDDSCDWERLGRIGKLEGFTWGGDWKRFHDAPHFEYRKR